MARRSRTYIQYVQSNLVADRSGFGAAHLDPNLIDPWGIAIFRDGVFAVTNAHSGVITFYTGTGSKLPLEVTIPAAPGSLAPRVSNRHRLELFQRIRNSRSWPVCAGTRQLMFERSEITESFATCRD